jgi:hypothetical protein
MQLCSQVLADARPTAILAPSTNPIHTRFYLKQLLILYKRVLFTGDFAFCQGKYHPRLKETFCPAHTSQSLAQTT